MERKQIVTIRRVEEPPAKNEPERQYGGPQSGLPPPYVVGSELAPYLIVGLDFGANYCRVSTFTDGAPCPVRPHEYRALVEDALHLTTGPLVHSLKHCISGDYIIKNGNNQYSAVDVTGLFLSGVKKRVEQGAERLLAKAVINVPSCFTHRQRQTMIKAAAKAEIAVLGLINEPTAVALDACFVNDLRNGKYLVVSSGAYSFEASVIHVQNRLIEVKAVRGSQALSGHAITLALVEALASNYEVSDRAELHVAVEREKPLLDSKGRAQIQFGQNRVEIDRALAGSWLSGHRSGMHEIFDGLLRDSHTVSQEIVGVILGGNATRLWMLNEVLSERFENVRFHHGNASFGAAIYAALLVRQAKNWVVWDSIVNPVMAAQGTKIHDVIAANSPTPINGHVCLIPRDDGKVCATIMQRATDVASELIPVASVEIVEQLPSTSDDSNAVVDLSIMVTSDGTLSFSARHKTLDVNLTVAVTEPDDERPVVDLTPVVDAPGLLEDAFEPGLVVERIGDQWFVQDVLEGSSAAQSGIEVYDELVSLDGINSLELGDNLASQLVARIGAVKKLVLMHDGIAYGAQVDCCIPTTRWRMDKLKFAISDATIGGETRMLVQALLDYGRYCFEVPDFAASAKCIARAAALACSDLGEGDILYLCAKAESCAMNISIALLDNENAHEYLPAARDLCKQVIHLVEVHDSYGTRGAKVLYELAMLFLQLNHIADSAAETQLLLAQIFQKYPRSSIPSPVWKRFEEHMPNPEGEKTQPA